MTNGSNYGTDTTRQRPRDRGSPSRNPKQPSERDGAGKAGWHQSQNRLEVEKAADVQDAPIGHKQSRSTVLTVEQEALIVAFHHHTLLPLHNCLYVLQDTIPHLTRSSLHRCLQRYGMSRLLDVQG